MALFATISTEAAVYEKPSDLSMPSFKLPAPEQQGHWIADPDDALYPSDRVAIDKEINAIRQQTDLNIVVVLVDEIKGDPEAFARSLYEAWGMRPISGNNDDGVLLLIVKNGDKAVIYTGEQAQQKISQKNAALIVEKRLVPLLRKHKYEQAIHKALESIQECANDPERATKTLEAEKYPEDGISVWWWVGGLCVLTIIIAIVCKYITRRKRRKFDESYNL